MRILILEDSPERIKEFRLRLAERGWTGTFVSKAKAAISHLCKNKYDLIFLDHDLEGPVRKDPKGENTGSEVARFINNNPDTVQSTVIIIHSINTSAAQYMHNLVPQAYLRPFIWTKENFSIIRT